MAESTIGASKKLKKILRDRKIHPRETYEQVILRIVEGDKK